MKCKARKGSCHDIKGHLETLQSFEIKRIELKDIEHEWVIFLFLLLPKKAQRW